MMLSVMEEGSANPARQARIYTSTDGSTWEPGRGTWVRHGDAGSTVEDVCELPDGTPFAVGSSQADPNAADEATTWTRTKDQWRLDDPDLKGAGASVHACATTGDTTVVSGSVNGDAIEWTTKDGTNFTPGTALPRGTHRGDPEEVTGGLVAPGLLDTAEHTGPVVWFSKDGKAWQWAPVDVEDASSSIQVRSAGDVVYAVTSQSSGDRIWTIDEIATTRVTGDEG